MTHELTTVACDWLTERDGGTVADAIRAAIGE